MQNAYNGDWRIVNSLRVLTVLTYMILGRKVCQMAFSFELTWYTGKGKPGWMVGFPKFRWAEFSQFPSMTRQAAGAPSTSYSHLTWWTVESLWFGLIWLNTFEQAKWNDLNSYKKFWVRSTNSIWNVRST